MPSLAQRPPAARTASCAAESRRRTHGCRAVERCAAARMETERFCGAEGIASRATDTTSGAALPVSTERVRSWTERRGEQMSGTYTGQPSSTCRPASTNSSSASCWRRSRFCRSCTSRLSPTRTSNLPPTCRTILLRRLARCGHKQAAKERMKRWTRARTMRTWPRRRQRRRRQ